MKKLEHKSKSIKGDEKWPVLVVRITLDNYNDVLTDPSLFFSLNTSPHTSVGLTDCISIVLFSVLNVMSHFI